MTEVTPAYPPMTAARAAALADFHERAITFEHGEVARQHGPYVTAYTDMLFTRDATRMPPRPAGLDKRLHEFIRSSCIDAALVRRWRRHRVVYTLDLDLGRELMTSDTDDVIPGGLVRQLPHPDPYLALPEPVLIPIEKQPGLFTQIKGTFLYALDRERHLVSTADSSAATIGLLMVGDVIDVHGRIQRSSIISLDGNDRTWSRTSLPFEQMTIGEAQRQMYARFVGSGSTMLQGEGAPDARTVIAAALGSIVPQVIYLCAANADGRPVPAVATRKRPDGSAYKGKAPKVVEFGYRIGPQLGRARRAHEAGVPGTTGRKMAPHVRRAHFHTYKVGPGRAESLVRWLAPIPINVDKDAAKTVVVPGPARRSGDLPAATTGGLA